MDSTDQSQPDRTPDPGDGIEQIAGMWLARRDRGLTAREQTDFSAWLRAHPRHATVVEELEACFHALDRASDLRPAGNAEPDPNLLIRAKSEPVRFSSADSNRQIGDRRRRSPLVPVLLAAAATVAVGLFVRSNWAPAPSSSSQGSVVRRAPHRIPLPDGSLIECKSEAKVDWTFTATERRVRLIAGDAHFTVMPNPGRPFIVTADDVAVRAVGTAFSVSLASSQIEVVVTEGRVRVDDGRNRSLIAHPSSSAPRANDNVDHANPQPLLQAGQRMVISIVAGTATPAPVVAVPTDELARAQEWRSVWLEFVNMPLADVTTEFNRHNHRKIRPADDSTARILVSGTFRADGVDAFVRLLDSSFGVSSQQLTDGGTLLHKTATSRAPE